MTRTSDRLALLPIDERDFIEALLSTWNPPSGYVRILCCEGMPQGANIVSVHHDPFRRSFVAVLEVVEPK